MCAASAPLPDWELVLSAAARLQRIVPQAVLVRGTAAAIHAGHRLSRDADHVLADLRSRFEAVLAQLESVAGWRTALADRLGTTASATALAGFDDLYPQDNGESALQQLQAQLANAVPYDLEDTDLAEYKNLAPRWQDWQAVKDVCATAATAAFDHACANNRERSS